MNWRTYFIGGTLLILFVIFYFSGCSGFLVLPPSSNNTVQTTASTFLTSSTISSSVLSSSLAYIIAGEQTNANFGASLLTVPDYDNDGINDFIAAAPFDGGGVIKVISSKTGAVLKIISGSSIGGQFGVELALVGENIAIGEPRNSDIYSLAGAIYLYSSKDYSLLYKIYGQNAGEKLGIALAGIGDIDGDGIPDFAGANLLDQVIIFSGKDGSRLHQFNGENAGDIFGAAICPVTDVNADGKPELLVGAPYFFNHTGKIYLFSLKDWSLVRSATGEEVGDQFGWSVMEQGDSNQDGYHDYLVGANTANPGGRSNAGSVYLFSGQNGDLLFKLNGEETRDEFGTALAALPDLNGDGINEIAVSAPNASPGGNYQAGAVYLFSGKNGGQLGLLAGVSGGSPAGFADGDKIGSALAALGSMGSGEYGMAVGAQTFSSGLKNDIGEVLVFKIK